MGRWAQARRRNSAREVAAVLAPPPAPLLSKDEGFINQTAQGADDTGGLCQLQSSPDGLDPWTPIDSDGWVAVYHWGYSGDWGSVFLRAREVGNDVAYSGASAWSNILDDR